MMTGFWSRANGADTVRVVQHGEDSADMIVIVHDGRYKIVPRKAVTNLTLTADHGRGAVVETPPTQEYPSLEELLREGA